MVKTAHQNIKDLFTKKFDHKLRKTTPVSALPSDLKALLTSMYESKDLNSRLAACLINALFTEQVTKFFLSMREMRELIKSDHKIKNITRKTLNDKEFASFKALLIKREIIYIEKDASKFIKGSKAGNKAAVCHLKHKEILELVNNGRPSDPVVTIRTGDFDDGPHMFESDEVDESTRPYDEYSDALPTSDKLAPAFSRPLKKQSAVEQNPSAAKDQLRSSNVIPQTPEEDEDWLKIQRLLESDDAPADNPRLVLSEKFRKFKDGMALNERVLESSRVREIYKSVDNAYREGKYEEGLKILANFYALLNETKNAKGLKEK